MKLSQHGSDTNKQTNKEIPSKSTNNNYNNHNINKLQQLITTHNNYCQLLPIQYQQNSKKILANLLFYLRIKT